ncbi:hypothetical protein AD933_00520 [Acetobacter malorum]|uniref:Uncharacterized protein n=1 Tax=Acetobacter malorum TaxID=178901 RepID=A0A149S6L9_9PROT|nr:MULTISPECIES: hypothetical protein [Acetobacter]KXV22390.1 hypothetical protein AD933_00520 [Acetobacter malorum]MBS0963376.1 hypothetical protein [Acetobacter persici]
MRYFVYFEDSQGRIQQTTIKFEGTPTSYLLCAQIRILMPEDYFFLLLVTDRGTPALGPRQFDRILRTDEGKEALAKEIEKHLELRLHDD